MSKKILEILIEEKAIDQTQKNIALQRQRLYGGKIGAHLLALKYIDAKTLAKGLSIKHNTPEIDPAVLERINPELVAELPIDLAKRYLSIPLMKIKKNLSIAMADPSDKEAIQKIHEKTGYDIRPYVAPENLIKEYLAKYYRINPLLLKSDAKPAAQKIDDDEKELFTKSFFLHPDKEVEQYTPQNELFLDNPVSEVPETKNGQYRFLAAPSDPLVFDLAYSKTIENYAGMAVEKLFLGLQRCVFLEISHSHLRPIAYKGWAPETLLDPHPPNYPITPNTLNFYLLLQESFYYGPALDIASNNLLAYLTGTARGNPENFNALFISLMYAERVLYIIYGDQNGKPIAEQYAREWKELQPKLENALEYLIPKFQG